MPTGSEAEVEAAPEELTLLRIQDALFDALEFVRAGAMATGGLQVKEERGPLSALLNEAAGRLENVKDALEQYREKEKAT
jgi:hypothetical protein